MNYVPQLLAGLLLPFAGTALGAATLFLFRREMGIRLQKALMGFAAGVMIAASVWSLLIPAMDMAREMAVPPWLPAAAGFLAGIGFLLLLDTVVPHLHGDEREGAPVRLSRPAMLTLAVTLHNIPEGMAVGVVLAAMLEGSAAVTPAAALALSAGIAIQNFPEGAVVAAPLAAGGLSRRRAFGYGVLSGAVEPAAAALTMLLTGLIRPALPYLLAFAAGAMIYVVVEELIPESQTGAHSNIGTIGAALGFALMMVLDVALG